MSRKAKEVSEIPQVSGRGGGADAVVNVATVEFRFWAVVLTKKWVFDKTYEKIGVAVKSNWVLVLVRLDGVVFQSYGSLNNVLIEKMFGGPDTFVVGNDCIKRCDIHSEKKFVSAKKTKFAKKFQVRVGCP